MIQFYNFKSTSFGSVGRLCNVLLRRRWATKPNPFFAQNRDYMTQLGDNKEICTVATCLLLEVYPICLPPYSCW